MLTGQQSQAELLPSFLWKFTEFRAETPPMPLEFQTTLSPLPTSSEFQSKKPPLSLGIPRCHPWYGYRMDIFWNNTMSQYLEET